MNAVTAKNTISSTMSMATRLAEGFIRRMVSARQAPPRRLPGPGRVAVSLVGDVALEAGQQRQDGEREERGEGRGDRQPQPRGDADGCRRPDGRRGREPLDLLLFVELDDRPGAEESDARDDALQHPDRKSVV